MDEKRSQFYNSSPSLQNLNQQTSNPAKITCRICLQQSTAAIFSYDDQQLFRRPCRCKGTSEFAHEGCLIQWFNRQMEDQRKEGIQQKNFTCQICQDYISVKMENKYECHNSTQVMQKIRAKKIKFTIYLVFFIIFVLITGGLAYLAYTRLSKQVTVIVIIVSILFGVGSLVFVKIIIAQFIIKKKRIIKGILSTPLRIKTIQTQINRNNTQGLQSEVRIEAKREKSKKQGE